MRRWHKFYGDGDRSSDTEVHVHALFDGAQPVSSAAVAAVAAERVEPFAAGAVGLASAA